LKLIQYSDERSKNDLDDEAKRMEWDLLVRQQEIEAERRERERLKGIQEEREKLQRIRERIDKMGEKISEMKEENPSLVDSLRAIFSWRNYSVYLTTAWVFAAFNYMGVFLNLYLNSELGWSYVLIGFVMSFIAAVSTISRLIGGYVGDVSNRKNLSVIAMFMMAAYNLILGVSENFTWILIALLFYSTMDVFKSGSTAFIMDNIPKKHSGLGISLFHAGRVFGIVTLGVFVILTPALLFGPALRLMFFSAGLLLVFCAIARAFLLEGSAPEAKRDGVSLFKSFIQENRRAANMLFKAVPGMITIVVLDSLSDALFRFGSYIYINEEVKIEIPGLTLMTIVTIIVSVPILLGTGRFSDRRGERKTALFVYSLMPLSALLLFIAPAFPYWVPDFVRYQADSVFEGLGALFSTPFVALILKAVNDAVWNLLLLTTIQKNLPRRDTAKILSVFWFIVYLLASIGPLVGGFIFHYSLPGLFVVIFILNIIILGWIATRGLVKSAEES
jgi:MFS family permease